MQATFLNAVVFKGTDPDGTVTYQSTSSFGEVRFSITAALSPNGSVKSLSLEEDDYTTAWQKGQSILCD